MRSLGNRATQGCAETCGHAGAKLGMVLTVYAHPRMMKRARWFRNLKPEDMKKLAVLELYPRTDLSREFYRKTFAAFAFGKWYQPRNQKKNKPAKK